MQKLADLLLASKRFDEAEALYRRILDARKNLPGDQRWWLSVGLTSLGTLCFNKGDYTAAEKHYRRALGLREEFFGRYRSVDRYISCYNLGFSLYG